MFLRLQRPLPIGEGKYAEKWNRFLDRYYGAFSAREGLSSLLVAGEGGISEDRFLSLLVTETGFSGGERVLFRITGWNYDLQTGLLLAPKDLGLQDFVSVLRKKVRGNPDASIAVRLSEGQAILYLCNYNRTRSAALRRSEYGADLQEFHFKLAKTKNGFRAVRSDGET